MEIEDNEYISAMQAGESLYDCRKLYPKCPIGHGLFDLISVFDWINKMDMILINMYLQKEKKEYFYFICSKFIFTKLFDEVSKINIIKQNNILWTRM